MFVLFALQQSPAQPLTGALGASLHGERLEHLVALLADVVWMIEGDPLQFSLFYVQVASEELPLDDVVAQPEEECCWGRGEGEEGGGV